ncbi:family 78 glycoside hydrolase catalytic domain [Blautia sp. Sow4_E7]|uniref:family 78 glycoside hydrolase catalytic domain n=1 Tax=Blautia sp. Sow4_E7 TaxID=3438749 RepID=UPI003F902FDA
MKINNLQTNHIFQPLGWDFSHLHFSWECNDFRPQDSILYTRIQIFKNNFSASSLVFDSQPLYSWNQPFYEPSFIPEPCIRYYWQVEIVLLNKQHIFSAPTWFETARAKGDWPAKWLTAHVKNHSMPFIFRNFTTNKPILKARLYAYGLGLYEAYLDGNKIGKEYLSPGYHSYDFINEYQTYDITNFLSAGEHQIGFLLGNGWYMGRFSFGGGYENLYGDKKMLTAILSLEFTDGTFQEIYTDSSWKASGSSIFLNNIYDGESIDATCSKSSAALKILVSPTCTTEKFSFPDTLISPANLTPRTDLPIIKTKQYPVKNMFYTPSGDLILDFGEIITGWVECYLDGYGEFQLQYGELLQNGEFYRDNLRTAKAQFSYKGTCNQKWIRPHFTYYGFRYVKVAGTLPPNPQNFTAFRLMSALHTTGNIQTSQKEIDTLFQNTKRSQECNFLSVPTDCPQRDERLGWTGDICIFARTACFHMDSAAFLNHYLINLALEQKALHGLVPLYAPLPKPKTSTGTNQPLGKIGFCAWGDSITVLPWEIYLRTHNKQMLSSHFPAMSAWNNYVNLRVQLGGKEFLWDNDRQLADWLALDTPEENSLAGLTDTGLVASAYYYYSTLLCQQTAHALGFFKLESDYKIQAEQIRNAFIQEFLSPSGSLNRVHTQTSYALILYFELHLPEQKAQLCKEFYAVLQKYNMHLSTGFIGTRFLLPALCKCQMSKEAYDIFLSEDYPGWLHEVKLGATSIWERWDSLDKNGRISPTDMNSLNHYAYGCVAGWMYEYICGFRFDKEGNLFLAPIPDPRLGYAKGKISTYQGTYKMKWKYKTHTHLHLQVSVPFQTTLPIYLPNGNQLIAHCGENHFDVVLS